MAIQQRYSIVLIVMSLALQWVVAGALAQVEPQAGRWKTHVLPSGSALRLPPPPDAAATRAELAELRALATQRDAAALDQISYWDAMQER